MRETLKTLSLTSMNNQNESTVKKARFEIWFDGSSKRWKLEDTQFECVIQNFKYESDAWKEAKRLNAFLA